jgi:hypothetical protein
MRVVLEAVVAKSPVDPALLPNEELNPINDVLLAALRDLSIDEVAAHIEADTDGLLELLAKLSADDENLRQEDFPVSLSEGLRMMPQHERMHIDQLRTALEAAR